MAVNRDNVGERGTGTPEDGNDDLMSRDGNAILDHPELVRTSGPAVAACVLAVVSLLLMPGCIWAFRNDTPESVRNLYMTVQLGSWFLAGVVGIAGLSTIATSGGRLVGKGFAWVGVSVPAAQVLFLFFFVVLAYPAHSTPYQMTCGTNLSGIGKAMLIYANDYGDELPFAGGSSSQWTGRVVDWAASDREKAFGLSPDGSGGQVSISASLYLLVRYTEVRPKSFICGTPSRRSWEKGMTEFTAHTYPAANKKAELTDFWDFGPNPPEHCSYAYQMVYGPSKLTFSSPLGIAILADRNPWMDSPSAKARDFSGFRPDIAPYNGTGEQALGGNTFRHDGKGQNVLFLDGHVDFEKRPFCGLDDDNIYTISGNATDGDPLGAPPKIGAQPANQRDSVLVNDPVLPSK